MNKEKLTEYAPSFLAAILAAQDSLAEWIVPDSKITDTQVLNTLLGILDDQNLVIMTREVTDFESDLPSKEWPESPNVERTTYIESNTQLDVTFKNGNKYSYLDVPKEVWEELLLAESIGSFLHRNIKGNFRYIRTN